MSLLLEDLHKRYATTAAVDGVSLSVASGRTLALLGPSGCGKSTLLRLIAGLEEPDRGRVSFDGRDVTSHAPQRRRFGVVFQDFALFPHLDVAGNVAFGLVEQGASRPERERRVAELLELVGLGGYQRRRVDRLSGGQQQRVALARALAPEPPVLLLDEPLSNLDEALRNELKDEIVRLLDELSIEAVYVTHDQAEAFAIADEVAVMRAGRIVQVGTREELLERPADAWTARFLGHENVWPPEEASALVDNLGSGSGPVIRLEPGQALLLRADLVGLRAAEQGAAGQGPADHALVEAVVVRAAREGLTWHLTLDVPAWKAVAEWRGHARELPGQESPRSGEPSSFEPPAAGTRYSLLVPDEAWHVVPGRNRDAQQ